MTTGSHLWKFLVRTPRLRDAKASLSAVVEAAEHGEATTRELVVVTLKKRHFDPLGIEVFNPFAPH